MRYCEFVLGLCQKSWSKNDPLVWDSSIDYLLVSLRRWCLILPLGYNNTNSTKATWNWNCNNIDHKVHKLSSELRISCPWDNYTFLYFANKFLKFLIFPLIEAQSEFARVVEVTIVNSSDIGDFNHKTVVMLYFML